MLAHGFTNAMLDALVRDGLATAEALHLPRFRPLASCRRRLLARVEASLWPASATLHITGRQPLFEVREFG
jgi:hypothetical protein